MKRMVAKFEDEIRECKQAFIETNDCLYKIELKEVLR